MAPVPFLAVLGPFLTRPGPFPAVPGPFLAAPVSKVGRKACSYAPVR